jgi:hypothetical protein
MKTLVVRLDVWIETVEQEVWSNLALLEHEGAFQEACEASRPFEVTNDSLDRANIEGRSCRSDVLAKTCMDRRRFFWISSLSSRPVSNSLSQSSLDRVIWSSVGANAAS